MQRAVAMAAGMLLLAGCSVSAPHPRGLSEEENAEFVRATQDQEWEWSELQADGYEQPVIRTQPISADDYPDAVSKCLDNAGFGDSYRFSIESGSLFFSKSPEEPTNEQRLALYICMSSFAMPARYRGYFSTDELDYIYDYFRDSLVPCLVNHGYAVELAPSRAEFTATPGYLDWHPCYQLPPGFPPERFSELLAACPYLPSGFE